MAGRNKTTAWDNVVWIKEHIPMWKEKKMPKSFLNAELTFKRKKLGGITVEAAIDVDNGMTLYGTIYNQPDFIDALKEICKKHKMPYGKVKPEHEESAKKEADVIVSMFKDKPKRLEKGKKAKAVKDIPARLREINYTVDNKILNTFQLELVLNKYLEEHPGSAKTSWTPELIELYIDMTEKGYSYQKMADIIGSGTSPVTAKRYQGILQSCGILVSPLNKGNQYIANEDIVQFVGGRKRTGYTSSLFD